jgi:hypothetical protein
MDEAQQYLVKTANTFENGTLPSFVNPGEPADEDTSPLTADEIQWFRAFKKEIQQRFTPLP